MGIAAVPVATHEFMTAARAQAAALGRPEFDAVYVPHPIMSADDIRSRTQGVWDRFYSWRNVWARAHCVESLKSRIAFVLISKLYRQMYANTGIATDSARINRSATWARLIAKPLQKIFKGQPMPDLQAPPGISSELQAGI